MENQEKAFEFNGIFDITENDVIQPEKSESGFSNPDYYAPRLTLDTVKNKTYSSRVRFVPNVYATKECGNIVVKHNYYMDDPDTIGNKFYMDCPSNGGMRNNLITNAYMMLVHKDSKNYMESINYNIRKNVKANLKRSTFYYALVHVMADIQQPTMVGEIKIFRFTKKINEKIETMAKGDSSLNIKSCIVFDPFFGKDLILKITETTTEDGNLIPTYEQSMFDGEITAMSFDGGVSRLMASDESKAKIYNFLKEKSPKLDQTVYKPMTHEEEEKMIRAVRKIIGDDAVFNKVYYQTYNKTYVPTYETASVIESKGVTEVVETTIRTETVNIANIATETAPSTSKFKSLKDQSSAIEAAVPAPKIDSSEPEPTISGEGMEINFDDIDEIN